MCPNGGDAGIPLKLTLEPEEIEEMDPRLQDLVLRAREGRDLGPTQTAAVDGDNWLEVIAKVGGDPAAVGVPGMEVRTVAGQVVTGRVMAEDVGTIHQMDAVVGLKAPTPVTLALDHSVWEIRADSPALRTAFPTHDLDGGGVIVGVVDFACDFRHRNFCLPGTSDKSRLLFLWDQRRGENRPDSPAGYGYGIEYRREHIDAALASADPYQHLGYTPDHYHGTHVLDITAGNGQATGNPGVAPGADLIFVHLGTPGGTIGEPLSTSSRLMEAVRYVFDKADALGRPAVVNLSLAMNGGPHDGTSLVEQYLDELVAEKPGRAIVVAAGNTYDKALHCAGRVTDQQSAELEWEVQRMCPVAPEQCVDQEMGVWYSRDDEFKLEIISPAGERLGPVGLGETVSIAADNGDKLMRAVHRRGDSGNGDNHIDIFLDNTVPDAVGTWRVLLHAADIGGDGAFHAWIEKDGHKASRFAEGCATPDCTLGSISTGHASIVVASYDSRSPERLISGFSSAGPTRDGRNKPDLSAPGQDILAARFWTQGAFTRQGTSMAAPHVAGLIALMMQAARQDPGRAGDLSAGEIHDLLTGTARKDTLAGAEFDFRYGCGRIDAAAAIAAVLGQPAPPAIAAERPPARPPALAEAPLPGADLAQLARRLADVATEAGVRVRVTLEVEPLVD